MHLRRMQVAESESTWWCVMASNRAPFAGFLDKAASRNRCVPREQARLCAFWLHYMPSRLEESLVCISSTSRLAFESLFFCPRSLQ